MKTSVLKLCFLFFILCTSEAHGRILELDERFLNVEKEGLWLVMFYAPWCGHCRKLEPTWIEVGSAMSAANSKVNVARLDATKYSSLASHYHVRGFPTIKFFKQGQQIEYNGPRTKESIVSFVNRAKGPAVTSLQTKQSFLQAKQQTNVMFVYVGKDDDALKNMYYQAAQTLFTMISFYSTTKEMLPSDVSLKSDPSIVVFKDGKFYEFSAGIPSANLIRAWIASEQFPSYSHLTGNSYHTFRAAGKRFAVAVLKPRDPFNATMHAIAVKRKHPYTFCWTEGNTLVNSITYSTISVPNLVVFDARTHEYFIMRDEQQSLTKGNVEKFFQQINDGTLSAMGGNGALEQIKRAIKDFSSAIMNLFTEQPLIATLIVIVPTLVITLCCCCLCSIGDGDELGSDDEYSEEDEDKEPVGDAPEALEKLQSGDTNQLLDASDPTAVDAGRTTKSEGENLASEDHEDVERTDEDPEDLDEEENVLPDEGVRQRIKQEPKE